MNKFKPGDKVRHIDPSESSAKYFRKGLTNLTILRDSGDDDYEVEEADGSDYWFVKEEYLELEYTKQNLEELFADGIKKLDIIEDKLDTLLKGLKCLTEN